MKAVLTSFFTAPNIDPAVAAANKFSIDSLYGVFAGKFAGQASQEALDRSSQFGDQVGKAVFVWSGSDGATTPRPPYVLPVGPGFWIPDATCVRSCCKSIWRNIAHLYSQLG